MERTAFAAGDDYAALKVEQRGIELIPATERRMTPAGLFWLWAGGIWNVEYLVYGALVISFGLSFGQAVLAIRGTVPRAWSSSAAVSSCWSCAPLPSEGAVSRVRRGR